MFHVPGRNELAFFDVDDALAEGGGDDQVGLPAEKRGDLQDVDDLGDAGHVRDLVHVGENGNARFVFDLLQNAQPPSGPGRDSS